jgi:hypothetical protein
MTAVFVEDGPDKGAIWHFGEPAKEQRALDEGKAWADLSHLSVVAVSGEDRLKWLHDLTTQYLTDFGAGIWTSALILDPQGHVEYQFNLVDDGATTWLVLDPAFAESLITYLNKMRFMLRVEVRDATSEYAVMRAPGTARIGEAGAAAAGAFAAGAFAAVVFLAAAGAAGFSLAIKAASNLAFATFLLSFDFFFASFSAFLAAAFAAFSFALAAAFSCSAINLLYFFTIEETDFVVSLSTFFAFFSESPFNLGKIACATWSISFLLSSLIMVLFNVMTKAM